MANEITYTGSGNLVAATALAEQIHEMLVDPSDLRPLVTRYPAPIGSAVIEIAQMQFDDALAAANTDEVTDPSNSALGTGNATITIARQALVREMSDLFSAGALGESVEMLDGRGQALAKDSVNAARLRFNAMLCALFPSLATSKGTSGGATPLTLDILLSAKAALEASGSYGPHFCVLHPVQWASLQGSLRDEVGTQIQMVTDYQSNGFYKGTVDGIAIFTSAAVTLATSDYVGAIFDQKCFGYATMIPANWSVPAGNSLVVDQESGVALEIQRDAIGGASKLVTNWFVGISEVEDLRGVKLVSI